MNGVVGAAPSPNLSTTRSHRPPLRRSWSDPTLRRLAVMDAPTEGCLSHHDVDDRGDAVRFRAGGDGGGWPGPQPGVDVGLTELGDQR